MQYSIDEVLKQIAQFKLHELYNAAYLSTDKRGKSAVVYFRLNNGYTLGLRLDLIERSILDDV